MPPAPIFHPRLHLLELRFLIGREYLKDFRACVGARDGHIRFDRPHIRALLADHPVVYRIGHFRGHQRRSVYVGV